MPGSIIERVQEFLEDLAADPVEGAVVEYVVREVRNGRSLKDALQDPYVKNRLSEERLQKVVETPEVIDALEQAITSAFKTKDFGFSD
jgi:hypothetical protein